MLQLLALQRAWVLHPRSCKHTGDLKELHPPCSMISRLQTQAGKYVAPFEKYCPAATMDAGKGTQMHIESLPDSAELTCCQYNPAWCSCLQGRSWGQGWTGLAGRGPSQVPLCTATAQS